MNTETVRKPLSPKFYGDMAVEQVIEHRLDFRRPPTAEPCEFCGNLLIPTAMVADGKVLNWKTTDCSCDGAERQRAEKRQRVLQRIRQEWSEQQKKINAAKAEKAKVEYTLSELKASNYPLDPATTPEPLVCEFCGVTVEPVSLVFLGSVFWKQVYCECEQGKAKHEKDEAEAERQRLEEERREEEAKLAERVRQILKSSGINNRFMSRTFANFKCNTPERTVAYNNAKFYADNFSDKFTKDGTGLYLEGTFGTGKTHLAVAIALDLIYRGINVICKTSIDLLMDIKSAFQYTDGEEEVTKRYKQCSLLVIDDLGKEQCTDWSLPKLYEIINDRYEKCKPTVVTTNYSHDELVRRLVPKGGDNVTAGALVSRLKECAIIQPMMWADWRASGR